LFQVYNCKYLHEGDKDDADGEDDDDEDDDDDDDDDIIIIINYSICKALGIGMTDKWYTHTCPSQCMKREMSQCCGIKQYTQSEKLQQIGQI
jgi:hypothetical protein